MKLTDIKTGDCGLIKSSFNIKNIDTWLSEIIRFGINFWNAIKGLPKCPANHVGIFVWELGKLWFYEATSKGFVKVDALEKFLSKSSFDVWIKRPDFEFDEVIVETMCEKMIGVKYNFIGIASQVYRQLFDERILLESTNINSIYKRAYCSQSYAAIMYLASVKKRCIYWPSADPEDLFFDKDFIFINQNN